MRGLARTCKTRRFVSSPQRTRLRSSFYYILFLFYFFNPGKLPTGTFTNMGDPFMAIMQKTKTTLDENLEEQFGKFEGWREELQTELRSTQCGIAGLLEGQREADLSLQNCAWRLAAYEASQATNSPAAGSISSEDGRAAKFQAKLNKWANPAAREVKLVERTLNRDRMLRIPEFRMSEINREPLQPLSLDDDGHTLVLLNVPESIP